jgi:hypothetical protein
MYEISNMIICFHHDNGPTYITKTAKKTWLLQQITPNALQR